MPSRALLAAAKFARKASLERSAECLGAVALASWEHQPVDADFGQAGHTGTVSACAGSKAGGRGSKSGPTGGSSRCTSQDSTPSTRSRSG